MYHSVSHHVSNFAALACANTTHPECVYACAETWVLSLRTDNTLGQRTTGVCEGWHTSLKGWVAAFLPRMHQRRMDATVHMLLNKVEEEMQARDLRCLQGVVTSLLCDASSTTRLQSTMWHLRHVCIDVSHVFYLWFQKNVCKATMVSRSITAFVSKLRLTVQLPAHVKGFGKCA